MVAVKKSPAEAAAAADPKPLTKVTKRAVASKVEAEVPASEKSAARVSGQKTGLKDLVPGAPEAKKAGSGKRKRLSRAFPRPLDKTFKLAKPVHDRFTFPEVEYAALTALKKRLADQGMKVKKSDILRAGLALVAVLDDENLQALLAKVPPLD